MNADYTTQLIYRREDENGDYVLGDTGQGFLSGREAMTQVLKTRLRACRDEWWEGDATAVPWFTDVLGRLLSQGKVSEIDLMVVNRIMDTVGVTGVRDIQSRVQNRVYRYSCTASTVYGDVKVEVSQ